MPPRACIAAFTSLATSSAVGSNRPSCFRRSLSAAWLAFSSSTLGVVVATRGEAATAVAPKPDDIGVENEDDEGDKEDPELAAAADWELNG
jgi:hypothetical protein